MNFYGKKPYKLILIHGGPGAIGELKPVAEKLSQYAGLLETEHYGLSMKEQIKEVDEAVQASGNKPLIILGHSWGAWLACLYAVEHPKMVSKLILVGSGPLESSYAQDITTKRLERLNEKDRIQLEGLISQLSNLKKGNENTVFSSIGRLIRKADAYEPFTDKNTTLVRYEVFQNVWAEAAKMRDSGELLMKFRNIQCPVIAIHGDYDPHPVEGVKAPLSKVLRNFRFHLLENCGHDPWIERYAAEKFYRIIRKESGI